MTETETAGRIEALADVIAMHEPAARTANWATCACGWSGANDPDGDGSHALHVAKIVTPLDLP